MFEQLMEGKRKYLLLGIAFFLVWGIVLVPRLNELSKDMDIPTAYLIFSSMSIATMGMLVYSVTGDKFKSVKYAIAIFLLYSAFDIYEGPLSVNQDGTLVEALSVKSSNDAFYWYFFKNYLSGFNLWLAVYVAGPLIYLLAAIYLLTKSEIMEAFSRI